MTGITFTSSLERVIRSSNYTPTPVDYTDIGPITERVKHIQVVSNAQGYVYKERGLFYAEKVAEMAKQQFTNSLQMFEETLAYNPNDKEAMIQVCNFF
jgi:hypothetical protein